MLEERDLRQEKVIAPLSLGKGFLYLEAVGNLLILMTKSITMTYTYLIQVMFFFLCHGFLQLACESFPCHHHLLCIGLISRLS